MPFMDFNVWNRTDKGEGSQQVVGRICQQMSSHY